MSGDKRESLSLADVQEWLCAMGFEVEAVDEGSVTEQLRDGVLLCQLVNRIKPNSVEVVRTCMLAKSTAGRHAAVVARGSVV